MNDPGDNVPTGFQGPIRAWNSLVPAASRVLRLPQDGGRRAASAAADAPQNSVYDLIEVRAVTESMGRIEDALVDLAGQLAEDATLLLDFDSLQSMRMLRMVVEGAPGSFDPAGSIDDPSQALALGRVLAAMSGAGLHVRDVIRVPAASCEVDAGFVRDLMAHGMLPIDWLEGPPCPRYWLVGCREPLLAGSVLIAGGSEVERQRTAAHVRAFLPDDWEILTSEAHRECAQWNRAVSDARGELHWFLRGGSVPTAAMFEALRTCAGVGPVIPGADDEPSRPGDIAGLMMTRQSVLYAGPLPERVVNTAVALEEYAMRLGSKLPRIKVIEGAMQSPPPAVEDRTVFSAETESLVERWAPIEDEAPAVTNTGEAANAPDAPWAGREPRVSLCMIARDEEHFLPECLQRARAAVP